MKRIDEIKVARQQRFWKKRMEKAKGQQMDNVKRELKKHVHLIEDDTVKGVIMETLEADRQKQKVSPDHSFHRRRMTR